jgi:hypothetical protein
MATVKKAKKYQAGGKMPVPKKPSSKDSVESEMFPGKMIPKSKSNYENGSFDAMFKSAPKKSTPVKKKAKSGGSFPDLNKDGKITKADILKGRGVIAKKGAKVSKAKSGAKKMMGGGKCKYGC